MTTAQKYRAFYSRVKNEQERLEYEYYTMKKRVELIRIYESHFKRKYERTDNYMYELARENVKLRTAGNKPLC